MKSSQKADVLIIGGGIIGLTLARELKRRDIKDVKILERNSACGLEASSAAAGMLAPQAEADSAADFFRFCSESRDLYPTFAQELFDETGVDVELDRNGTLYLAFNEHDAEELEKRFEWQTKANLKVEKLSASEVLKIEPNVAQNVVFGLYFPNDWQVENRKIIIALRKFAELNDIKICTNTEVKNFLVENHSKIVGVETTDGKFFSETLVLATGAWTSLIHSWMTLDCGKYHVGAFPTIRPIRGQMICYKTANRMFSKVIYTPRGYIVPRADGRILAGATVEDVGFDKSVTESGVEFLRGNSTEISPLLADLEIYDQWANLRPLAAHGLPVLGTMPYSNKNLFFATGHYRNGILLAPLTAKVLADKIIGNVEMKYLDIFSPYRRAYRG